MQDAQLGLRMLVRRSLCKQYMIPAVHLAVIIYEACYADILIRHVALYKSPAGASARD